MGKCCLHASSFIFDQIIIKVAGNQDRHKSLDEFDFGPDQTTHFWVTCPWMMKILHFGTWISLRPVGQSWSNFMCSITGGGERLHIFFEADWIKTLVSMATESFHWLIMGKMVSPPFLSCFWCDPFYTCRYEDMHKISNEFELWLDRTTDYGVSCLERLKNFQLTYNGKMVSPC